MKKATEMMVVGIISTIAFLMLLVIYFGLQRWMGINDVTGIFNMLGAAGKHGFAKGTETISDMMEQLGNLI